MSGNTPQTQKKGDKERSDNFTPSEMGHNENDKLLMTEGLINEEVHDIPIINES